MYQVIEIRKFKRFPGPFWAKYGTQWFAEEIALTVTEAAEKFVAGEVLSYVSRLPVPMTGRIIYSPITGEDPAITRRR